MSILYSRSSSSSRQPNNSAQKIISKPFQAIPFNRRGGFLYLGFKKIGPSTNLCQFVALPERSVNHHSVKPTVRSVKLV